MRTLYTLFALISLVLVALVATAAGGPPTLSVVCAYDQDPVPDCPAGSTPTFTASGLNARKVYGVVGVGPGPMFNDVFNSAFIDKQGNYSQPSSDGALSGTWTFDLWQFENGLPFKHLDGPHSVTFDD